MEEFKLYLLAEEMISYIKDLKDSSRRLLEWINTFDNVAGYKTIKKKPIVFLYINNEHIEETRKTIPFMIVLKNS
jgi:hypothetical protein